jgi:hypothetical protein
MDRAASMSIGEINHDDCGAVIEFAARCEVYILAKRR